MTDKLREELTNKFVQAKSAEEIAELFKQNIDAFTAEEGEISPELLDSVSGGGGNFIASESAETVEKLKSAYLIIQSTMGGDAAAIYRGFMNSSIAENRPIIQDKIPLSAP